MIVDAVRMVSTCAIRKLARYVVGQQTLAVSAALSHGLSCDDCRPKLSEQIEAANVEPVAEVILEAMLLGFAAARGVEITKETLRAGVLVPSGPVLH